MKIDFISYNLQKRTPFISPQVSLFCHCLCGIFHYRIKVYTCTIKNHTFKNLRRSDGYFIDHTASSSCWDCLVVDVNTPPVAVTAGQLTKIIPLKGLVLDGRNSTDDKKIDSYSWVQTG